MKRWSVTIPATALAAFLFLLAWPVVWPFVVIALALPLLSVSALLTILGCARLLTVWAGQVSPAEVMPRVPSVPQAMLSYSMVQAEAPKIDHVPVLEAMLIRFALVGSSVGFTFTKMRPYVSRTGWDYYTDWMVEQGELVVYPRTDWAPGKDKREFIKGVMRHRFVLPPCPTRGPYPVSWVGQGDRHR